MPPRTIRSPAKMKNGIAIIVKTFMPEFTLLEDDDRRQAHVERRSRSEAMPRQKATGVPISSSRVKTPKRIGEFHGVSVAQRATSSAFGSWSTSIAGGAQHEPLEREERDQHAARDDRHVVEAAGQAERPGMVGGPGARWRAARRSTTMPRPKTRTARSEIARIHGRGAGGRKCTQRRRSRDGSSRARRRRRRGR